MDKAKRKRIKRYIIWACMAAVVALLTAMPLLARTEAQEDGPQASVLTGTVEKGSVTTTLRGGGTLTGRGAQDVTLPEGVKITQFLVENGDVVSQGDAVAAVDKVSVMSAIVEIQDSMTKLLEQIDDARNETVSNTVKATAGGRIKAVYAQPGDSVQDVMLEHGALAVLSLDGLMAVQLERQTEAATGDAVTVTMADGTKVPGRVESNLDGVITVTVEDEGFAIGQAVSVTDADDRRMGAGVLYVHNAWKATAFAGTVSSVQAKEERTVTNGTVLMRLTDTEFEAQLQALTSQYRSYEELLQELFQMHRSGVITAPCDGEVSGVDEESTFLLSAAGDWEVLPLAAREDTGWTVQLLSGTTETTPSQETTPEETPDPEGSYTGYPGRVTHIGLKELIVTMSDVGGPVTVKEGGGWDISQVTINPQTMLLSGMIFQVEDASAFSVGDIIVVIYDEDGEYEVYNATPKQPGGTFPGGSFPGIDIGSILGGLTGGRGTAAQAQQNQEPELYDAKEDVLLTVTPRDVMELTIPLDEKDIARVSPGMTAQVKVDAIRDQVFQAEVTEVGSVGTNNGGSSKFSVKLVLEKTDRMLAGMSASAQLELYTRPDVLTVPVAALMDDGARTVICTAVDPETGEPGTPVEVTVGLSDGVTAELISGLKMGDSFCYSYYDTVEIDHSAVASRYSFG